MCFGLVGQATCGDAVCESEGSPKAAISQMHKRTRQRLHAKHILRKSLQYHMLVVHQRCLLRFFYLPSAVLVSGPLASDLFLVVARLLSLIEENVGHSETLSIIFHLIVFVPRSFSLSAL